MSSKKKIGVLVSGRGSNLQALLDAISSGELNAEIAVVLSDKKDAAALIRAEKAGIANYYVDKLERDTKINQYLKKHQADILVLAGYLKKIGSNILEQYQGRIINIHPSLLPKFGGHGMYGINVHRAVIAAGEKVSGATVHLVTGDYDKGPILAQVQVPVDKNDTAEILAARVLIAEHKLLINAVRDFIDKADE